MNIFINGRFLSQPLSGVQRYAMEIVHSIDQILETDTPPEIVRKANWTLLTPPNALSKPNLKIIDVVTVGTRTGHLWDQTDLAFASRNGSLISLANSGPIFHHDHRIVIHDAQVFRHPEYFDRKYAFLHRVLGRALARRAKIATVSQFSRRELAEFLRLSPQKISVYPNSAEHLADITPDFSVLTRLNLSSRRFFLTVGSLKKNKNIQLALDAAELLDRPDYPLVVVGSQNDRVFRHDGLSAKANVIFAGHLSDEELVALYHHATAFVFPSLYEGFGVPPLEAMLCGCPAIVSDIGAAREVCGDAATYFDPTNAMQLCGLIKDRIQIGTLTQIESSRQKERLVKYSWRSSAMALLNSFA